MGCFLFVEFVPGESSDEVWQTKPKSTVATEQYNLGLWTCILVVCGYGLTTVPVIDSSLFSLYCFVLSACLGCTDVICLSFSLVDR
jgi:hypothetical protein